MYILCDHSPYKLKDLVTSHKTNRHNYIIPFVCRGHKPYYAHWGKGEVDMIGLDKGLLKPAWALEIKWSNRYHEKPTELKSLLSFCSENKLDTALVTTIDIKDQKEFKGVVLQYVPAATYAYNVGKNTLDRK